MCWCCKNIGQRLCRLCDCILAGTVGLGAVSTAATASFQYTGDLDDWRAIAICSAATLAAVLCCVLRCVCRAQSQLSLNEQTIIVNLPPRQETEEEEAKAVAVAIPVDSTPGIEMKKKSTEKMKKKSAEKKSTEEMMNHLRNEWRLSRI